MRSLTIGMRLSALLAIGLFGLGFLCHLALRYWGANEAKVAFEPQIIEVSEAVSEGEEVEVDLALVNDSNSAVMLEYIQKSCGCLELLTEDGESVKAPRRLECDERLRFRAVLTTTGLSGNRAYGVTALGSLVGNRHPFRTEARVNVRVIGGLRPDPDRIVMYDALPGQEAKAEIRILDGHPWPGVKLKEVRYSDPDAMHGVLERLPFEENPSPAYHLFVPRYKLHLRYQVPTGEDGGEESIEFVPEDATKPAFEVPVIWYCSSPKYRLWPRALVMDVSVLKGVVHRSVRCTTDETAAEQLASIAVVARPDYVQVRLVRDEPGAIGIELDVDMDKATTSGATQVVFGDPQTNEQAFVLPVRLIGSPDGDRSG